MNKAELITKVSSDLKEAGESVTNTLVGKVVDGVFATLQERLYQEEEVKIAAFGAFSTTKKAERPGRNPSTGEAITIAASTAVKFKPAKQLKDYVQD
jgi:DNA-binding protein HU-beta